MSKRLIAAGISVAALGVSVSPAVGAGATKSCSYGGTAITGIRATKTSCKVARNVANADLQGKKFDGWKCTGKQFTGGSHVTCTHKGGGKIKFTVHQGY